MTNSSPEITDIDQYIATFPKDIQALLKQMRSCIRKAAPNATEQIIYRIPTFYYNGNLVHFAAFKNHIGFFPTPSAITAFRQQLRPYKSSKGAVQFPIDEALPLTLVEAIVKFRVNENSAKKPKR